MKKLPVIIIFTILLIALAGCASAPKGPAPVVKTVKKAAPVTIDFGPYWTGTVRTEKKSGSGNVATVQFYSEWTRGENAGNVYPKKFTSSSTGNEETFNGLWDNGGEIKGGTYDVRVDIDGMPGKGTIKNLNLKKGTTYKVYISFAAAKIDIGLKTDGDDIFVYPAGTYDKYKGLGRLDNIPNEILINHINSYTERNQIYWIIPAGVPLDILRTYSNGDPKWFTNYTATPESFVKKLQ